MVHRCEIGHCPSCDSDFTNHIELDDRALLCQTNSDPVGAPMQHKTISVTKLLCSQTSILDVSCSRERRCQTSNTSKSIDYQKLRLHRLLLNCGN
jgi:hypothetical protein